MKEHIRQRMARELASAADIELKLLFETLNERQRVRIRKALDESQETFKDGTDPPSE